MKVKYVTKNMIHQMVSQLYTPLDGDKLIWFVSKHPDTKEVCIVSACGTDKEVDDWVRYIHERQAEGLRKTKQASWSKQN